MRRALVPGLVLAAVYLLVMTSLDPGDVAMALVLGIGIAAATQGRAPADPLHLRARAVPGLVWGTAAEVVRGSWRVARFCLTDRGAPGFVELPREGRTDRDVALWGLVTGEAPDEIVVDVDEERDVLVVHLIDARDPDAVRARHHRDLLARRGEDRA